MVGEPIEFAPHGPDASLENRSTRDRAPSPTISTAQTCVERPLWLNRPRPADRRFRTQSVSPAKLHRYHVPSYMNGRTTTLRRAPELRPGISISPTTPKRSHTGVNRRRAIRVDLSGVSRFGPGRTAPSATSRPPSAPPNAITAHGNRRCQLSGYVADASPSLYRTRATFSPSRGHSTSGNDAHVTRPSRSGTMRRS